MTGLVAFLRVIVYYERVSRTELKSALYKDFSHTYLLAWLCCLGTSLEGLVSYGQFSVLLQVTQTNRIKQCSLKSINLISIFIACLLLQQRKRTRKDSLLMLMRFVNSAKNTCKKIKKS